MISSHYVTIDPNALEGYSIVQAESGQIPITIQTAPSEAQIQADSGITDENLINISAREVNQLAGHLPPDQIKLLKQRRRTLKNREYAAACRNKRSNQREDLKNGCDLLNQKISDIDEQNEKLKNLLYRCAQKLNFKNVQLPRFLVDDETVVLNIINDPKES